LEHFVVGKIRRDAEQSNLIADLHAGVVRQADFRRFDRAPGSCVPGQFLAPLRDLASMAGECEFHRDNSAARTEVPAADD